MASLSHEVIEEWAGQPERFRHRVVRPRPSRRLKYTGFLLIVAAYAGLVGAYPLVKHYESANTAWWHRGLSYLIIICICLALARAGGWLWNQGANRKR